MLSSSARRREEKNSTRLLKIAQSAREEKRGGSQRDRPSSFLPDSRPEEGKKKKRKIKPPGRRSLLSLRRKRGGEITFSLPLFLSDEGKKGEEGDCENPGYIRKRKRGGELRLLSFSIMTLEGEGKLRVRPQGRRILWPPEPSQR